MTHLLARAQSGAFAALGPAMAPDRVSRSWELGLAVAMVFKMEPADARVTERGAGEQDRGFGACRGCRRDRRDPVPFGSMLARTDALSRLRTTLADSKQRADLVEQLQQAVPAAVLLGGSDAVDAAWRAVCHVARTWP